MARVSGETLQVEADSPTTPAEPDGQTTPADVSGPTTPADALESTTRDWIRGLVFVLGFVVVTMILPVLILLSIVMCECTTRPAG